MRVTERDSNGDVYVKQHDYVTAADKLAKYEDLEEQGLLIRKKSNWFVDREDRIGVCNCCYYVANLYDTGFWHFCPNCGAKMRDEEE